MKKIIKLSSLILLSIFSFYYTNKVIELLRFQDPIMKKIQSFNDNYEVKATNAIIDGNTIIPGKNGQKINQVETYNKMKKYGAYNELLMTFEETKPDISIDDYYDKYIIGGITEKKSIALVFKVKDISPKEIVDILNDQKVQGTFFIDGSYLENNTKEIISMTNHQLELLSYDNNYEEIYFSSSKDYLESITNKTLKFCYCDYDKEEVITLCQKLKMHTVLPTKKIGDNLFSEVKNKLTNAAIISIPISKKTEKELLTTIKYIKSRGYNILTLTDLISESVDK